MTRAVQVSFHHDVQRRDADSLLEAWPTLLQVAAASARAGTETIVVQRAHRDEMVERDGVRFHFVRDLDAGCPRTIARATSLSPDVVHTHGLNEPWCTGRLARALPEVPILVQDHGAVPPTGIRALAWRWPFRAIDAVSFTARSQADVWVASGILPKDVRVFEVLGGSSDFEIGDRAEARAETSMRGDPCVIWTGRLDENKDPLTMLDAIERAASLLPELRLYCCFGDAPLLDLVERRIAGSSLLSKCTVMLGRRPHAELETRFRAADIFVQTSHREASGFSLLESLACGVTPVVTDIPAARAIVGEVGVLVPVGDAVALASALVTIASGNRAALRIAARARFDDALTYDAIGQQLFEAYEALTSNAVIAR